MEPDRPRLLLSRRQLLLAGAGTLVLASCGGDDGTSGDDTSTSVPEVAGGLMLYKVFSPEQPVGVPVRLPLALADEEGSFDIEAPSSVTVRLEPPAGGTAGAPITVERREQDIPRGYYPLRTTFDAPGRWRLVVVAGGVELATTLDVRAPGELPAVPSLGDILPVIPTPTVDDSHGVDPLCTRETACPFHIRSLDQVIGGNEPILLLVSTPAFCKTAICGPVLELVIERQADLEAAGVAVIHAEVYVDGQAERTSPTVDALGLTWEPALFLAAPDGTVTDRLDYTFDATELDEAVAKLIP